MAKKTLRQRALSGETVLGAMIFEFFVPGMPQILRNAGCEYAIYDMEHGGLSLESLKMLAAASRGTGVVPMVESAEQARGIAESARYPSKGRRGAAFGFAHDNYEPGDPQTKMREADRRNLVIAQVETENGLDAVEEIAAVEGIDCLWLGHFDLTNFLGIPGQFGNPAYMAAVKRIVAASRKNGKALGFMAADAALARQYKDLGFNMIATGTDQGLLISGVRAILQSVRED